MSMQKDFLLSGKRRQGSSVANIILGDFHNKKDYEDRSWNLAYLERRFRAKELEDLFKRYEQRSLIGTFTTYLVLQSLLSIGYIAWTAIQCELDSSCERLTVPSQLQDTIGQSCLLAICIILLLVVYNENIFKDKPWLLGLCSFIIVASLEIIDIALVIYHTLNVESNDTGGITISTTGIVKSKVPIISLYNHLVIYLFLPITRKFVAVMFGLVSSLICIGLFVGLELSNRTLEDELFIKQLLADMVFYACLNFVGFYVRYVGEINMRRGFLDKRGCIDATFKLKYEKEQEENLLLSIIPKHIATPVRHAMWKCLEQSEEEKPKPFKELFIEGHENVSMLFADICNFTVLTTRLPVEKLVQTLNDLFGKFDQSAEKYNCMRIKILGDCYYCVSGVPEADPQHAHNCVEMGLDMINLISDVRREHEVEVDMRIGIHSGYILSGVIGLRKWQFDIWSKDVTIANAMEAAGKAGAVHVTSQTKLFLGDSYTYKRCDLSTNPVLIKNGIQGFLIFPKAKKPTEVSPDDQRRVSYEDHNGEMKRRHSVMLDNSVRTYQDMLKSAERFMRDEIEKLPLRKFDQWLHPEEINPLLLLFREKSWEMPYLREYDPLFKFYILASFIIVNAMGTILLLTEQHPHIPLWIEYTVLFVFLVLLLPCLWVSYVWDQIIDPYYENDSIQQPANRLLKLFYNATKKINMSMWVRHTIFIVVIALIVSSAILDVTSAKCIIEDPKNYTYRCALALMVIFLFLRIHHLLKLVVVLACLGLYGCFILGLFSTQDKFNIFNTSYFGYDEILTEDQKMYSHFVYLGVCALFFFFMDRQHEYMNRLDYQWKRQLKSEQEQARLTKLINKTLLQNILPQHISTIFLSKEREEGELYSEEYTNVAVLFASIPDYMEAFRERDIKAGDYECLETLNEIMNSFDKLLYDKEFESNRVEKIKIISSTYMAACGLLPGRNSSLETSGLTAVKEPFNKGETVKTLTKFAAAMMRALAALKNKETKMHDFQLRIGVNVGHVIAGVVGAQKPLYDIWGDTVNVASRMDYFGQEGKIQVTEDTAKCLMQESINCTYRDVIDIKGKGLMTTYFVDLTPDFNLVLVNSSSSPSKGSDNETSTPSPSQSSPDEIIESGRFYITPTPSKANDESFETESISTIGNTSGIIITAEIHTDQNEESVYDSIQSSLGSNSYSSEIQKVMGVMDDMLESHTKKEQTSEKKSSRLDVKKDSGYGSQGLITVDKSHFKEGGSVSSLQSTPEPLVEVQVFPRGDLEQYYEYINMNAE